MAAAGVRGDGLDLRSDELLNVLAPRQVEQSHDVRRGEADLRGHVTGYSNTRLTRPRVRQRISGGRLFDARGVQMAMDLAGTRLFLRMVHGAKYVGDDRVPAYVCAWPCCTPLVERLEEMAAGL